jgi:hypothetical protein
MNIALEGTREFVDGKMRRSYGDAFVRGNNGAFFFFFFQASARNGCSVWVASKVVFMRKGANVLAWYSHIHLCRLIGYDWSLRTRATNY